MIESFACKETKKIFEGERSRKLPPKIQQTGRRKLIYLNEAADFNDLRSPPANRLEALKGGRKGQYSIRINQQSRICFTWKNGAARQVEIVDYH